MYNVMKSTVILYTNSNRHAGTPYIKNKQKICGTSSNIVVILDFSISCKDKATGSPIVVTLGQ